ncbi:MAG: hypothetical protein ACMVP2_26125 [Imperialibacter sp.]|uniref:hypothetical protein n=1 Tax=Imperialibacter sp. TaxID=2038411 RepID=UPI003A850455
MIRFNFFLQSVLCGLAVLLGMAQLAFGESVYWLLILALPLGVTQFLASIQLAASAQHRSKPGLVHTTVSTLYLVTVMFWGDNAPVLIIAIPACLAVLFWYVSFQAYRQTQL